jgi:hypothetical protein
VAPSNANAAPVPRVADDHASERRACDLRRELSNEPIQCAGLRYVVGGHERRDQGLESGPVERLSSAIHGDQRRQDPQFQCPGDREPAHRSDRGGLHQRGHHQYPSPRLPVADGATDEREDNRR